MKRPQADAMLGAWGALHGLPGRFNSAGLLCFSVGTTPVVLEWSAAKGAVMCRAVVYRFDAPAAPAVREKLERAGLEYLSEARALCVSKALEAPLEPALLDLQLEGLVAQSLQWATSGLDRLFG